MMVRKISAHYAFTDEGKLIKYPIISFSNNRITDVSSSDSLNEVASLEFYSGVLFPLFCDRLSLNDFIEIESHSSFELPIVSKIVFSETSVNLISQLSLKQREKVALISPMITPNNGLFDELPLIERISELVENGFFKDYLEAFTYYTSLNEDTRGVSVGLDSHFVLCSDLSLLKGGRISTKMFRLLC